MQQISSIYVDWLFLYVVDYLAKLQTDKASMLDEVINYLKQLQAQIQMMNRTSLPQMMVPLAMQQQFQMSMLARMGAAGLGMGMGMVNMNMGRC